MEQRYNFIIIDVQGFFINNKYYAKEACVSVSDFEKQTFHIKSKYSEFSKNDNVTNKWLYNHLHKLHWNTGESTMKDLIEYIILTIKKERRRGITH